jgi:mono/diheme cytochrome c family protein
LSTRFSYARGFSVEGGLMRGRLILALIGLALLVVIIVGWIEVQHGFSARDNPTALEAFVARKVRMMAIPSDAKNQKNPYTATAEILTDARRHFADHCATCHGNDGRSNTAIGRNLYPKAPDMRLQATQDLTDGALYYIIHNGIRLTGMPAWGEAQGNDEDSWKLVLFLRHLPKLMPEEEKDMEQYNPQSRAERAEQEEEEEFLKGGNPPSGTNQHHH